VRPLGPDAVVFIGVRRYRDGSTFDVAAEGAMIDPGARTCRVGEAGFDRADGGASLAPIMLAIFWLVPSAGSH
jgi:hypothetical protein